MPRTDVRHLRYFVAVAEECHFGRAAARLHVTTPPLSQRIRELEEDLGLSLFERTSRKVTLTPAGERLLVEARDVLRAMDRFDAVSEQLASSVSLPLRVGYCHGSEGGVMRAIRALVDRAAGPRGAPRRPDIAPDPRRLAVWRSCRWDRPCPRRRPGADRLGALSPGSRRSCRRAGLTPARGPVPRWMSAISTVSRSSSSTALEAPTAHDEIAAYCTSKGVRPAWVTHAPTQVERVLDLVGVGGGIGWLNSWQAEREATHSGVVVKPLRPVGLYDEFRVAWRVGDAATATSTFVRVVLETCGG